MEEYCSLPGTEICIKSLVGLAHLQLYRITGFNCVLKSLHFRDFKVIANLHITFVWHMSYYLNRSGYPLALVLGTKCLEQSFEDQSKAREG